MRLKELLDENEKNIKAFLTDTKKELVPMLLIGKDKEVIPIFIQGDRDDVRIAMDLAEKIKPDWVVFVTESYMEAVKNEKDFVDNYEVGSLGKRFNSGDKSIKEIVVIQAYTSKGKLMRTLLRKNLKPMIEDVDVFDGYLAISDVERIFWRESE